MTSFNNEKRESPLFGLPLHPPQQCRHDVTGLQTSGVVYLVTSNSDWRKPRGRPAGKVSTQRAAQQTPRTGFGPLQDEWPGGPRARKALVFLFVLPRQWFRRGLVPQPNLPALGGPLHFFYFCLMHPGKAPRCCGWVPASREPRGSNAPCPAVGLHGWSST